MRFPWSILRDGAILSVLASLYLIIILRINPRLFLQDYPEHIQKQVPPKTPREKRLSLWVGIPFLLLLITAPVLSTLALEMGEPHQATFFERFLNAAGVVFIFNLVDLVILDWLIICWLRPDFLILPGVNENITYQDYAYHFKAFLKGTLLSILTGLVTAGLIYIF